MMRDILDAVLPILLPALAIYAANLARQFLKVQEDSEAGKAINLAVERAAGVVYQRALQLGIAPTDSAQMAPLYAAAQREAAPRVAGAMDQREVSQQDMTDMIKGSFGQALAGDPNVLLPETSQK